MQDVTVNVICNLVFVFLSFHLGIASTIFFFSITNRSPPEARPVSHSAHAHPLAIEMVYIEHNEVREKNDTL